jgi:AraC family transcriptional regulator
VFSEWLPQSNFELDHRPHFEILPLDYIAKGGQVTEEVWIPIKVK